MLFVLILLLALFALYLFLLMPRMGKRPDHSALLGRYYTHRGLYDNAAGIPENSMAAFRKSIAHGYGMEMDVQLTADGVPVVFHDDSMLRVCGVEGQVSDYTFEELQQFPLFDTTEHIPRFADFLALVDGQVPIIVEIKAHGDYAAVCAVIEPLLLAYKGAYCVESFHPMAVRWFKTHRPEWIRGQLSTNYSKPGKRESAAQWTAHHLLVNALSRPDFVAYDVRYFRNLSFRVCKALFRPLTVAWTVKSQKQLDECRSAYDLFIFEGFLPE
ncbi:MAG: glycerophosphodiester phosphodiesterase [Ruminococcaceae bacterium]|nr:glycerophosphodiester phosphodiesterase [Oscillospiraceae bacterium]